MKVIFIVQNNSNSNRKLKNVVERHDWVILFLKCKNDTTLRALFYPIVKVKVVTISPKNFVKASKKKSEIIIRTFFIYIFKGED